MNISDFRTVLERRKGQLMQLESKLSDLGTEVKDLKKQLNNHIEAREIIIAVGLETQKQLQFHISDITTLALEAVFVNPYELKLDFIERRNKTECDITFVRDNMQIDPIRDSGIGAVDVAAFALRIASWSMANPRTMPCLILDEPFKHLKGNDENKKVLQMMNTISKKLGLQIIMISDERIPREDIIENADRVFEVINRNGKSKVRQL